MEVLLAELCRHGLTTDSCRVCWDTSSPNFSEDVFNISGEDTSKDEGVLGRHVFVRTASTIKPEKVDWLVPNFIPKGAITIVSGREGLGKSLLTVHWAAELTTGRLTGNPQDALFIASEDSPAHVIVPRLIAAGADLSRIHFPEVRHDGIDTGGIVLPLDISRLREIVNQLDIGIIVLDPLSSALSTNIDSHKDASVRQALDPLSKLARETDCSVLAVMHWNKGAASDLNSRVMAARAFVAVARSHIAVASDPDKPTERVAVLAKSNLGPLDVSGIGFRIEQANVASGVAGLAVLTGKRNVSLTELTDPSEDMGEQKNATLWLRDYLFDSGGEALKVDIDQAGRSAGYSTDQLRRARERAGVVTTREKRPQGRSIWQLKIADN